MLSSVFLVNKEGVILIEKQYRERVRRVEVDDACDAIRDRTRTPPGIVPRGEYSILLHLEGEIWVVGVCEGDEFALFAVSVLQYIGQLLTTLLHAGSTEMSVKSEYCTVYQILDYAVDFGFPFLNEGNTILTLLTRPPPEYSKGERLQLDLQRPWRIVGARHSQNEILVDFVEFVDVVVRQDSRIEFCHIRGSLDVRSHLSDMPRCRLVLSSSRWEDVVFHRCAEVDTSDVRAIPFVPPDGDFTLMKFRITALAANLPLVIVPKFRWNRGGVQFEVTIKAGSNLSWPVDDVEIRFELPRGMHQLALTVEEGKALYDAITSEVVWTINVLSPDKPATLTGGASTEPGFDVAGRHPVITAKFASYGVSASGLRVERLDIENTKYKSFKGVKYVVRSGNYEFRTGLSYR
jgi:hypothetical protein